MVDSQVFNKSEFYLKMHYIMENTRTYKYLIGTEHYITRKEKHQYVFKTILAMAILTRDIYLSSNVTSTTDHYSTAHMQYKMI